MSKNKPTRPQAIPYVPVEVHPQHCSDEELTTHLEAFVKNFIIKVHQERWLTFFVEKRSKWYPVKGDVQSKYYRKAFNEFEQSFPLETMPSDKFVDADDAYPQALLRTLGMDLGVYFDLRYACKITAAEAATLVLKPFGRRTALLSLVPGKKVLFFDYDEDAGRHGIWVCRRT